VGVGVKVGVGVGVSVGSNAATTVRGASLHRRSARKSTKANTPNASHPLGMGGLDSVTGTSGRGTGVPDEEVKGTVGAR